MHEECRVSMGVRIVAMCSLAGIAGFLVLFVWSALEMPLSEGLGAVLSTRWGITTVADLGAGLVIIGVWIALLERRASRVVPWCIALVLLGNFTALVYLLVRCRRSRTLPGLFLGASDAPGPTR